MLAVDPQGRSGWRQVMPQTKCFLQDQSLREAYGMSVGLKEKMCNLGRYSEGIASGVIHTFFRELTEDGVVSRKMQHEMEQNASRFPVSCLQ